jgi:hypothetical protein
VGQAAQTLGLEEAMDGVAVQVRQDLGDHKGEVVEGKARGLPQGTDNGPLLLAGRPGQLGGPGRAVPTGSGAALAPDADGLGGHAKALGQHARGLRGKGDLPTDGRSGAGVGVDGVHQDLPWRGNRRDSPSKRQAQSSIAQRTWSQECSATKQLG